MAKAIVTGGAGFIGHHLVNLLLDEGYEVEIWDNLSTGKAENIPFHERCDFVKLDLTIDDLPTTKADKVFHLAAPISVQESIENPEKYKEGILKVTQRLLDWAIDKEVSDFIFASTAAVYGSREDVPFRENSKLVMLSPYARYKRQAESILLNASGININILRFFNVFGEHQHNTGTYAPAVAHFLRQHSEEKPLTITGDGTQTRDYIYVKDICSAMYNCILHRGIPTRVMNIGYGEEVDILTIAKTISDKLTFIPARLEPREVVQT